MDLSEEFIQHLLSQASVPSKITIANYRADVKQFIRWFEKISGKQFDPKTVTPSHIHYYKTHTHLSASSLARHLSSLRRFFIYLQENGYLIKGQFPILSNKKKEPDYITGFALYLVVNKASELTIKQYKIDVKQFLGWVKEKIGRSVDEGSVVDIFSLVDTSLLDTYALYLARQGRSQATVYTKLSAVRKYKVFLEEQLK